MRLWLSLRLRVTRAVRLELRSCCRRWRRWRGSTHSRANSWLGHRRLQPADRRLRGHRATSNPTLPACVESLAMRPVRARRDDRPIVVLGGGLAGGNAAVTLREEGFKGRVVIVTKEPGVPFGRPPLSKTYLRSEEDLDAWYVRPSAWYEEQNVEQLRSGVVAVDVAAHRVVLDSGQELEYQKLLIATGGRNRRLEVPGARAAGGPSAPHGRRVRRDQARGG